MKIYSQMSDDEKDELKKEAEGLHNFLMDRYYDSNHFMNLFSLIKKVVHDDLNEILKDLNKKVDELGVRLSKLESDGGEVVSESMNSQ